VKRSFVILVPMVLALLSCKGATESTTSTTATVAETSVSAAPVPATTTSAMATQAAATPAAPMGSSLASQETNWPGITADITEFRRKGNTLTAKIRFINKGSQETVVHVHFDEMSLIDTANAKKYEALKDEKGNYIAGVRAGYKDQWYDSIGPGQSMSVWAKFPAPPPEVKSVTLQMEKTPPFEDMAIQD
jgi:hypothetical protein